jgi:hypothetical protein
MLETDGRSFSGLTFGGAVEIAPRLERDELLGLALRIRRSILLTSSVINGSRVGLNVFSLEWMVLLSMRDEGSTT